MRHEKNKSFCPILSTRSISEIQKKAIKLRELVKKKNVTFEEVKYNINPFLKGYNEWIGAYHVDDLYRARKWTKDELPIHLNELLAPPAEDIKEYGRINIPNQRVLYLSEITQTILNELRLNENDKVVLLRIIKRENAPSFYLSDISSLPPSIDIHKLSLKEKEIYEYVGGKKNFQKIIEIKKQIINIIKTEVSSANKDFYKLTSALTHHYLNIEKIHGVMYPSVTTKYHTVNIAAKPSIMDTHFQGHSVAYMKINNIKYDMHFVDTLRTGVIDDIGNIIWNDSIPFESPVLHKTTFKEYPTP